MALTSDIVLDQVFNLLEEKFGTLQACQLFTELKERLTPYIKTKTLDAVVSDVNACQYCQDVTYHHYTARWNTKDPDYLFVLDRPGLPKAASKLLLDSLTQVGFTKENSSLTYINKCAKKNYNEQFTPQEIEHCKRFFYEELSCLSPKIIITLGAGATRAVLGPIDRLSDYIGQIVHVDKYLLMPTYTPTYVLNRSSNTKAITDTFISHLKLAYQTCIPAITEPET